MQQGGGGSQYGVPPPDMAPFGSPGTTAARSHMIGISASEHLQQQQQQHQAPPPEAASPISSRPPAAMVSRPPNFEELAPTVPGGFPDEDALAAAGEEAERSGAPGNRWPRQETLALLKIRSEMDAAFRDATLKGPLWDEVSRKLAEQGFIRSAKKCKEKFENVHKYYKRTKEGRAGRQDGKSYRFFSQLEALHSSSAAAGNLSGSFSSNPPSLPSFPPLTASPVPSPASLALGGMAGPSARIQSSPISASPITTAAPARLLPDLAASTPAAAAAAAGISFSSNSSSSASSESDDEDTEEGIPGERRKRKHPGSGSSGSSRKMMAFFEGLMKQVMERQEAMQQKFLETIEKREQDKMIREEAWKRQEMARLNRENELMAQERAMAASRDAAVISFLQKITGQTIQLPPGVAIPTATPTPAAPGPSATPAPTPAQPQQHQPPPQQQQQQPPQQQHHLQSLEIVQHQPSSSSTDIVPVQEAHEIVAHGGFETLASSRWPKAEVHSLIKLRSGLESRYQEAGPKGPLWEEISSEMQKFGYNRSAKRCKEKWENINKYFKKVKESNKKRPEDAKTCPYFHQLDALYRKKLLGSGGGGGGSSSAGGLQASQRPQQLEANPAPSPQERPEVLSIMSPPQAPPQQAQPETENNNGNGNRDGGNPESGPGGSTSIQIQTSNGALPPNFFDEGPSSGGAMMKKPEDIMKELMEQQHHQAAVDDYDKLDEPDSDNMDQDEDDEDEDEDRKMQYKIQFQRPNVGGSGGEGGSSKPSAAATTSTGSFLAMVQ